VHDAEGRLLGRLDEIRAVAHGGQLYVSQYLVGRYGVAARLTSSKAGRLGGSHGSRTRIFLSWSHGRP
jgi:hypothetical protein